jgi:O-antigen/teichoic acid export membrane protein
MTRLLASTVINVSVQIAGSVLPALFMIVTFPAVKATLSAASFATFAFLFTAISLMSVLDVGLGRSVTYFAARHLQAGQRQEAVRSLWAAMVIGLALSAAAAAVVLLADNVFLAPRAANAGVDFHTVLRLLWFLPVFMCGALLRGFLEAEQRFLVVNGIQLVYGAVIAFAPLAAIRFTTDIGIYPVIFGLIRSALVVAYVLLIRRTQPGVLRPDRHIKFKLREVMRYAQWLFASNLAGVAIVYADRIAVAASLASAAVSAYVVPMDLVMRGQVLIGALSTVLFPLLVRMADRKSSSLITGTMCGQFVVFGAILVLATIVSSCTPFLLESWMGKAFSVDATLVARVAVLGLAPVGCASLAMTVLHAQGRTAHPAALHMIEFPLYSAALWGAARTGNVVFILASWLGRLCFDMAGQQALLLREHPRARTLWLAQQALFVGTAVVYFVLVTKGLGSGVWWLLGFGALGVAMIVGGLKGMPGPALNSNNAGALPGSR